MNLLYDKFINNFKIILIGRDNDPAVNNMWKTKFN